MPDMFDHSQELQLLQFGTPDSGNQNQQPNAIRFYMRRL
ncbi:Uncharacterised protein [Yersinia frederiksenii]|uniref:Uncharacterized protein n=1 Tax=Yersinia frederiksenii TaxID=29484 RepID=A0A380SD33_YERFR|nr:Uncharacterised protein [Yersinia frederiksenii]